MPRTCEMSSPTVTANWLMVPSPPRRVSGAISEMYMGTSEVLRPTKKEQHFPMRKNEGGWYSPQFTPIMNLPNIKSS